MRTIKTAKKPIYFYFDHTTGIPEVSSPIESPTSGKTPQDLPVLRKMRFRHTLISFLILTVSLFLILDSMKDESSTVDEFDHIAAGYAYLKKLDYNTLDPGNPFLQKKHLAGLPASVAFSDHPPLVRAIATLPLLIRGIEIPTGVASGPSTFSTNYFYQTSNPDEILRWSRLPIVVMFIFLVLLIGKWASELYGLDAGVFALFLAAFNINFMAYSRYVTTDIGLTLFYTMSLFSFMRVLKSPSMPNLLLAGLSFGLAQVSKFSAVLLVPTLTLAAFYAILIRNTQRQGIVQRTLMLAKILCVVFTVGFLIVAAVYSAQAWNISDQERQVMVASLAGYGPVAQLLDRLFSVSWELGLYGLGIALIFLHNVQGHVSYFLGELSKSGSWTYFPITVAIKTQLPLLALLFIGLFFGYRSKPGAKSLMLIAALVYIGSALTSNINVGIRHVLPLYPLAIIEASKSLKWTRRNGVRSPVPYAVITVLGLWYLASVFWIHPYYTAYFNELAGGPSHGQKYLADSNLDWGQDIKRFAEYGKKTGIENINVFCADGWNQVWPCKEVQYYLPAMKPWSGKKPNELPEELPTGFFAIGRTPLHLAATWLREPAKTQWRALEQKLESLKPVATIGYSVDVYYLPEDKKQRTSLSASRTESSYEAR